MKGIGKQNIIVPALRPVMAVILTLLLYGFPLAAQEPVLTLQAVSKALDQSGYTADGKDAMAALFKTMERQGLPLAPLFRRWQQGEAKGASLEQLLGVLEEEKRRLSELGDLLDLRGGGLGLHRGNEYYLNRFLALYRNGLSREDIGILLETAPDGVSLDRGSLLVLELNQWGLTGSQAVTLTAALLQGPLPPEEYGYIIPLLQRGLSSGLTAAALIDEIILYLPRSRDLLDLQEYLGL